MPQWWDFGPEEVSNACLSLGEGKGCSAFVCRSTQWEYKGNGCGWSRCECMTCSGRIIYTVSPPERTTGGNARYYSPFPHSRVELVQEHKVPQNENIMYSTRIFWNNGSQISVVSSLSPTCYPTTPYLGSYWATLSLAISPFLPKSTVEFTVDPILVDDIKSASRISGDLIS